MESRELNCPRGLGDVNRGRAYLNICKFPPEAKIRKTRFLLPMCASITVSQYFASETNHPLLCAPVGLPEAETASRGGDPDCFRWFCQLELDDKTDEAKGWVLQELVSVTLP